MAVTAAAPGASAAERLLAALLCLGVGLGLAAQISLAWGDARVHGAGMAPGPVLAIGLVLAVAARCLPVLARDDSGAGDEIGWIGLLLGAGIPVAFTRMGAETSVLAVMTAGVVFMPWWLAGQVCGRVLVALSADLHQVRRGEDLGGEVQGAVFANVAMAALAILLAQALFGARPGPVAGVTLAAQCACGCLLVAAVHRRSLLRRAAAQEATVLPAFRGQNAAEALVAVAAGLLVGAALPGYAGVLGGGAFAGLGQAARRLLPTLHAGGPPGADHLPPPAVSASAPPAVMRAGVNGAIFTFLAELAGVALIAFLAWGVLRVATLWIRHRAAQGWPPVWQTLSDLWHALLELLRSLLAHLDMGGLSRLLARLGWRERTSGAGGAPAAPGAHREHQRPRWADPRLRVRAAYRHLLAGAVDRGHRRPRWATPRAFRHMLAPMLPPDPTALGTLTHLYEEARYSTHPLDMQAAGTAEAAAQEVLRRLPGMDGAARRP